MGSDKMQQQGELSKSRDVAAIGACEWSERGESCTILRGVRIDTRHTFLDLLLLLFLLFEVECELRT